jgi:hypothetical protein
MKIMRDNNILPKETGFKEWSEKVSETLSKRIV